MKKTLIVLTMTALAVTAMAVTQDDMTLYRPSTGMWYVHETEAAPNYLDPDGWIGAPASVDTSVQYGGFANDAPLVGDIDGDGLDDVLVTRDNGAGSYQWLGTKTGAPLAGQTVGQLGAGGTSSLAVFGNIAGNSGNFLTDTTGNGAADVVTINTGFNWYRQGSGVGTGLGGGAFSGPVQFGSPGDIPVMGDFNGDTLSDKAVVRNWDGVNLWWGTDYSSAGAFGDAVVDSAALFGWVGDTVMVGDINGDGRDDGVIARDNGAGGWLWAVGYTDAAGLVGGAGVSLSTFGLSSDVPTLADVNGDGKLDLVATRGGTTSWFANFTNPDGTLGNGGIVDADANFGAAGDIALFGQFSIPEPASVVMLMLGSGVLWIRKRLMI